MGETWQQLFHEWVTWARSKWLSMTTQTPHVDTPYTFLDKKGKPWRSTAENADGQPLSKWLGTVLKSVCSTSPVAQFNDLELQSISKFTPQEAR
jgi:hypothetical protein